MNSARQIWGMPLLLAVLTLAGVLAALLGEGVWRWMCWGALCVPVGVGVYFALRRS